MYTSMPYNCNVFDTLLKYVWNIPVSLEPRLILVLFSFVRLLRDARFGNTDKNKDLVLSYRAVSKMTHCDMNMDMHDQP